MTNPIPKMPRDYRGKNFKKYIERCDARWKHAEEQIKKIINDDAQWELFKQQVASRDMHDSHETMEKLRRNLRDSKNKSWEEFSLRTLTFMKSCCMRFICDDGCEYNPNPRKGARNYTKRKRFDCTWRKTRGDVFAKYTGAIEFNDENSEDKRQRSTKLQEMIDGYDKGKISAQQLLSRAADLAQNLKGMGSAYQFNDTKWTKAYKELAKIVIEEHTNRKKAPSWLDVNKGICPHYYIDLSKP